MATENKLSFRKLRADEIDCRIGSITEKGLTLLLYKDARCDMNVLDETVGPEHWFRDHKELKGNMYCGVGIYIDELKQVVWKWDCGAESNTEAEKGEASDSFKRACVNWGIGRELYTAPFIFIGKDKCDIIETAGKRRCYQKFKVAKLTYNAKGDIDGLAIMNESTHKVVFTKMPEEKK